MKFRSTIHVTGALALATTLAGCSFSGLDASSKFSCAAPDGVTCMSVSGIYANARANNLPGQVGTKSNVRSQYDTEEDAPRKSSDSKPQAKRSMDYFTPENNVSSGEVQGKTTPAAFATPNFGSPLRTPERILRVWLAPYEDSEGDLHDQKYLYVQVNKGQWTIEANKVQIRNKYRQIRPLSTNNPANKVSPQSNSMRPQEAAMDLVKPQRGVPMDSEVIGGDSMDSEN